MANSLLDFVMSLVRDPDAAEAYAADPAQAIAAANLTNVTSTDVNNLIPVVSESLSTATPTAGADAFGADPGSNVWTSGAATAAFDAFDAFSDRAGGSPAGDAGGILGGLIDQPGQAWQDGADYLQDAGVPLGDVIEPTSLQLDTPAIDDPAVHTMLPTDEWGQAVTEDLPANHPGLDLFD